MSLRWSVVIPTYRRPEQVAGALASIASIDPPRGGHEVIVVDDGGGVDLSATLCADNMRLIVQENTGPAGARNHGARKARGEFLVFTDDDCRPSKHWLTAFDEAMDSGQVDLLGGSTQNGLPENPYSSASQTLATVFEDWEAHDGIYRFFASNNIALQRSSFLEIGGFDTSFPLAAGEDRAFCDSWRRSGRTLRKVPEAKTWHHHALTLGSFWRQHRNYGRGAALTYQRRASDEKTVPDTRGHLALYKQLAAQALDGRHDSSAARTIALMALSQFATIYGFGRQSVKWT